MSLSKWWRGSLEWAKWGLRARQAVSRLPWALLVLIPSICPHSGGGPGVMAGPPRPADRSLYLPLRPFTAEIYRQKASQSYRRH